MLDTKQAFLERCKEIKSYLSFLEHLEKSDSKISFKSHIYEVEVVEDEINEGTKASEISFVDISQDAKKILKANVYLLDLPQNSGE